MYLLYQLDINYAFVFCTAYAGLSFWVRNVAGTLAIGLEELPNAPSHSLCGIAFSSCLCLHPQSQIKLFALGALSIYVYQKLTGLYAFAHAIPLPGTLSSTLIFQIESRGHFVSVVTLFCAPVSLYCVYQSTPMVLLCTFSVYLLISALMWFP